MAKQSIQREKVIHSKELLETARVGYASAIELYTYEGETIWSRFSAMVIGNSILVAAISQLYISDKKPLLLIIALAFTGILLDITWFVLMTRSFAFQDYWLLAARELEELYLFPPVQTYANGEILIHPERKSFTLKRRTSEFNKKEYHEVQMPAGMASWFKIRDAANLAILINIITYLLFIAFAAIAL